MTEENAVQYWLDTAQNDQVSALDNFTVKHYDWAFFQWHLSIEKLLKGYLTKASKEIPYTHDLVKLASLTDLTIPENINLYLEEINTYNISARYDDYKRTFYHKVTQASYYNVWHKNCQEVYTWFKTQY